MHCSDAPRARVVIGCMYRPRQFERRTPMSYEALNPAPSADAELLQRALLTQHCGVWQRLGRLSCAVGGVLRGAWRA